MPPSRITYEKSHPTVSFRLEKGLRDELNSFLKKNNLSKPGFIKVALQKQKENYEAVRNDAYDKGFEDGEESGESEWYTKGRDDWAIWVYCCRCNKPVYVRPNSDNHKRLIDVAQGYFSHEECPEE